MERFGDQIYNVIFRPREPNEEERERNKSPPGRSWSSSLKPKPSGMSKRRRLRFVRVIAEQSNLILVPINLMRVRVPDGEPQFVALSLMSRHLLKFGYFSNLGLYFQMDAVCAA